MSSRIITAGGASVGAIAGFDQSNFIDTLSSVLTTLVYDGAMIETMTNAFPNGDLVVVGEARTPWSRGNCPKNMARARESGRGAELQMAASYRAGLEGLKPQDWVLLVGWFGPRRDPVPLLQQPSHLDAPRGVFALRSPVRPNPIALSIARIEALDVTTGVIRLDALDWFDGTPVLDIKPYFVSTDGYPVTAGRDSEAPNGITNGS